MSLLAGLALRQFRKETQRKIGDRGLFTTHPRHAHGHTRPKHSNDEAYLKFLKEEQELRYRRMKKSDHQRVAYIVVYCSLPILLLLIGYWWQSH